MCLSVCSHLVLTSRKSQSYTLKCRRGLGNEPKHLHFIKEAANPERGNDFPGPPCEWNRNLPRLLGSHERIGKVSISLSGKTQALNICFFSAYYYYWKATLPFLFLGPRLVFFSSLRDKTMGRRKGRLHGQKENHTG